MKKRFVSFSFVMVALLGLVTLAACPKEQPPATLVDAGPAAGSVGDALGTGISGSAHQAPGESDIGKLAADAVILKVDGVTYTKQRLDQAIIQTGLAAGIPPAMLDGASKIAFEKPAYEKLIERQLLIGEAKKRKLFPTMEEADAQTKGDRDRVIAQLPPGKTFADMLKEMGTDEAQYQSELQNDVAIARLLQSMEKAITEPSEEALKKVYEDNKAYMGTPETASVSHVLIALPEGAPEADVKAATAKAEAIAKEAKGKDKEAFAKKRAKIQWRRSRAATWAPSRRATCCPRSRRWRLRSRTARSARPCARTSACTCCVVRGSSPRACAPSTR
jgi:parvulin-like peptidyl-prolyl isomerase